MIFALILLTPLPASCNDFHVDGFDIRVYWKLKRDQLRTWGDVRGERDCQNMTLDITFYNSREEIYKDIRARVGKVKKNQRAIFKGKTSKMHRPRKNNWSVSDIQMYCR